MRDELNNGAWNIQYTTSTHFAVPYVQWGMRSPSNFMLKVDPNVDMDIKTTINAVP